MKQKIIIYGTGEIAELAKFYFDNDSDYLVEAFTVEKNFHRGEFFLGKPLVPFDEVESMFPKDKYFLFVAISYTEMNSVRERIFNEVRQKGYKMVSYISSRCTFLTNNDLGENCFILENNTIQPFVKIGNNVFIWSGNHIGHHSEIKDHNFISSQVVISGHCIIESNCFIGVNAAIAHNVVIGDSTLVGAGAVIAKNTEPKSVYVAPRSLKLDKKSTQFKL